MAVPPFTISVTARDSEGTLSVVTMYSKQTYATILTKLADLEDAFEEVSDAVLAGIQVTRNDPNPDASKPAGNVDVEIQAKLGFLVADGASMTSNIPAFKRELLVPNGSAVDVSLPPVVSYLDLFLSRAADGLLLCDSRGENIVSLKFAQEAYANRMSK